MEAFLKEVTGHILDNHGGRTGDICIVTPNRRAGLFFRKYFSDAISAPMWAPEVLSIEELMNKISGFAICDRLTLLFEFYQVYSSLEGENAGDVDAFFTWAPVLLRDFDDVDNALADPIELYSYLEDIRYIETWNPDGSELTPFQKNYLEFAGRLGLYHTKLASRMTGMKMAWQGLSSRKAAKLISGGGAPLPWEKVIFTGFNALTRAEESVIEGLLKEGRAEFISDSDPYYEMDPDHEAGIFIRKYRKRFNTDTKRGDGSLFSSPKNIRIYGVAKNVNQARLAGNIIRDSLGPGAGLDTAVVLANEELLIPVLNSLPAEVENINVTMGYPLSKTNMFEFFDTIFSLHLRAAWEQGDKGPKFYYRDLQRLFSHSSTMLLWDRENGGEWASELLRSLASSNMGFCGYSELVELAGEGDDKKAFPEVFYFLQQNWQKDPSGIFRVFKDITARLDVLLREKAGSQGSDIVNTPFFVDFESLYYFARIFRQMESYMERFPFIASLKTLHRLTRQAASETRLSFSGEPLKGLQVMGMLETRSLDFKNIILLSANEDILPKKRSSNSIIPYEVRKSFGLRLYREQDAIYSYHFYRLLQRAENIYLVYNTQSQDIGSNEKSRFITQLLYELPEFNPETDIKEEIIPLQPPPGQIDEGIVISKTQVIVEKLLSLSERGFSPSALATYINCPLQFYFERVLQVKEAEDVEEVVEAKTMGIVVHGVMEDLYRPFTGKVVSAADIRGMHQKLDTLLENHFRKGYKGGSTGFGKNFLLAHLTKRYIENILREEEDSIEKWAAEGRVLSILELESFLGAYMMVPSGGRELRVKIHGKADRVDRLGDVTRVIDYKTGKVQGSELSYSDWSTPFINSSKAKNFQLLCYAWLYHKNKPETPSIEPGIISTRQAAKGSQTMRHPGGKGSLGAAELELVEEELRGLLMGILDPGTPFTRTGQEDNCRYCQFTNVCRRFTAKSNLY